MVFALSIGVTKLHAQICFTNSAISESENGVTSIFIFDLDQNGTLDILAANRIDNELTWLSNSGGENPDFQRHVIASGISGALDVHAADVDGDGIPDVIAAARDSSTVSWFRSNGATIPSFTRFDISTSVASVRSVFAIDIDLDGDTDILSASHDDDTISWFENDGAPTPSFTQRVLSSSVNGAITVHAADMDNDGDIDVIAGATLGFEVLWFENDGNPDPSFTVRSISTTQNRVRSVYAADMEGDGDLDILAALNGEDAVVWMRNNGAADPTFTEYEVSRAFLNGPEAAFPVDFDNDGDLDVIAASINDDTIAWFENNGNPNPVYSPWVIAREADGAITVSAADLDGDGSMDGVSGSNNIDAIIWHRNQQVLNQTTGQLYGLISTAIDDASNGDTLLAKEAHFSADCDTSINFLGKSIRLLSAGEVLRTGETTTTMANGASLESSIGEPVTILGTLDVPFASSASVLGDDVNINGPLLMSNNSTLVAGPTLVLGGVTDLTPRLVSNVANGVYYIETADLNGDGNLDIVSAEEVSDSVYWYQNTGGANPTFVRRLISSGISGVRAVRVDDIDADGLPDVLAASADDSTVGWFRNLGGAVPAFSSRMVITSNALSARSVHTTDLDDDGDIDVLIASHDDDKVAWYESNGGSLPTFTEHIVSTSVNGAITVHSADMDGDGDIDIIAGATLGFEVLWFENDGSPTPGFTPHSISTTLNRVRTVHPVDLDNDGDLDILAALNGEDAVVWLRNSGGRNPIFVEFEVSRGLLDGPESAFPADFDGDGDQDIIAAAINNDTVAWFENDGAVIPGFTPRLLLATANGARSARAADIDGDGDIDGLSASANDDRIIYYRNGLSTDVMVIAPGITVETDLLQLINKTVFIDTGVEIQADIAMSLDTNSLLSGPGSIVTPLLSNGGEIELGEGDVLLLGGSYEHRFLNNLGRIDAGLLSIDLTTGFFQTSMFITGEMSLGGGLVLTAPPELMPVAGVPLAPIMTSSGIDPAESRFDIVLSPVLDVISDGAVVSGTMVTTYTDDSVQLVAIPLEELLFTLGEPFAVQGVPNDAVLADVSGAIDGTTDGILDLIVAVPFIEGVAPNGAIAIFYGDIIGDSFAFTNVSLYTGPEVSAPIAIEVGNFTNDEVPDIAFANSLGGSNNDIYFLNANTALPNSVFLAPIEPLEIPNDAGVTDLSVGEVLLIGSMRDDLIAGIRGNTQSTLAISTYNFNTSQWETCEVDVDDIDSVDSFPAQQVVERVGIDRDDRVVASSPSTGTIRVFTVPVNGDFEQSTFEDFTVGQSPRELAVGTIDADTLTDIVVVNRGGDINTGSISVLRGNGVSFAAPVEIPVNAEPSIQPMPLSATLTDIDDDSDLDLVIVALNEAGVRSVRQLRNVSEGGMASGISFAQATDTPDQPSTPPLIVLGGDLNGDSPLIPDDFVVLVEADGVQRGDGSTDNQIRLTGQEKLPCRVDFDANGELNFFDVSLFIQFYIAQNPLADLNADSRFNFFDVSIFVTEFQAGCP